MTITDLVIRDEKQELFHLTPNPYRERFDQRETNRNIILCDRQVGISTWILAKAFLRLMDGEQALLFFPSYEQIDLTWRLFTDFAVNLPGDLRQGLQVYSDNQKMMRWRSGGEVNFVHIDQYAPMRGKTIDGVYFFSPGLASQSAVHQAFSSVVPMLHPGGQFCIEQSLGGQEGVEFWNVWNSAEERGFTKHLLGC